MINAAAVRKTVTKFLTTPGRVAQGLDWKGQGSALLTLHFNKDSIDLAVGSHPEGHDTDPLASAVQPLPSIPLQWITNDKSQKVLDSSVLEELNGIVQDFQVCGFVVSWPVQKEGRCGASCGRVLHTLDHLLNSSGTADNSTSKSARKVISASRPVCLWDMQHYHVDEDAWGRSVQYSQACSDDKKTVHYASKEQYQERTEGVLAAQVAADYMRHHWPQLVDMATKSRYQQSATAAPLSSNSSDSLWMEPSAWTREKPREQAATAPVDYAFLDSSDAASFISQGAF